LTEFYISQTYCASLCPRKMEEEKERKGLGTAGPGGLWQP